MTNTQAISFWKFLSKYSIEIPIIQRDYAQGRKGNEDIRKGFLVNIKHALDNNLPDNKHILKLDFVYGSEVVGKLNPLDGQQRLTTLWLLHWYIALRADKLTEASEVLKKFTYETRISSREFCEQLCYSINFKHFDGNNIVDFIMQQTWFYSTWKQDPTIQSMLRMLGGTQKTDNSDDNFVDSIEDLFKEVCDFNKYWDTLTNSETIVFYYLPLQNFGLSDDLYIKMNARGKQLTNFENFKADLIGYINKQGDEDWNTLLNPKDGIPIKIDSAWTDIFWSNRSNDNKIDEIYFTFINRFFWNELFTSKDAENKKNILDIGKNDENSNQEYNNPSYKYLNDDVKISYKRFEFYKYHNNSIPKTFFDKLVRVLDNYLRYGNAIPVCNWDSFEFIPKYEKEEVTSINQVQRVVFFAICKYFDHDEQITDTTESLTQWMRVVWNLVSEEDQHGRSEIRSTSVMRSAIEFIDSLDPHKVYSSLINYNVEQLGNSSFDERCKEEIVKANQILCGMHRSDGKTWEQVIVETENYEKIKFKGSIRFLFTDDKGKDDWQDFDAKFENMHRLLGNQDTIKYLIPYLSDEDIRDIFSKRNLSNEENNLRMLFQKFPQKVHNFLLQKNKTQELSLLQKDILLLCKSHNSYWIHKEWVCNIDVLSNYAARSGYYEYSSFFIGQGGIYKFEFLKSHPNITINNTIFKDNEHEIFEGLFVSFKYKYNNIDYYFRWQINDWIDMYDNDWKNNLWEKNLHAHYKGPEQNLSFTNIGELIEQLNRCCKEYEKIKTI